MDTIVIAPFNMFYTAFLQCIILREYKPQLKISLCGFFNETIEHKVCCATLTAKSIDISHLYLVHNEEEQENCRYSESDWKFIAQHSIVECYAYDTYFQEILKRKQSSQFLSVHFKDILYDTFSEYFEHIGVLYARNSSKYFNTNYNFILQNCSGVFVNRLIDTNQMYIFYNHHNLGEQPCQKCNEEYFIGHRTIFTYVLRETNNVMLAKHNSHIVTQSIINSANIKKYKKYSKL